MVPFIVVVVVYNKGHQKTRETTREIWRSEVELQSLIIAEDFILEMEYVLMSRVRVRVSVADKNKPLNLTKR